MVQKVTPVTAAPDEGGLGHAKIDQSYGHAALAESESSISRRLQLFSDVTPVNMRLMSVTLLTNQPCVKYLRDVCQSH